MLDPNVFTLVLVPRETDPEQVFLIDDKTGDKVYMRTTSGGDENTSIELYDALSSAPLASLKTETFKKRIVELHNPPLTLEVKSTGMLNWEFSLEWERFRFYWRKDILGMSGKSKGFTAYITRKPDPDVKVACYRPDTGKKWLQIYDYNLRRFQLEDRRGLETVLVTTLLCFIEGVEKGDVSPRGDVSPVRSRSPPRNLVAGPPIPESSHAAQPNEVVVDRRPLDDFVTRGLSLLSDPLMLYIFFSAKGDPDAVAKAVKAAEAVKRRRKVETGEELVQYVVDDDTDSSPSAAHRPPQSIRIFLSRTPLDDLAPRASSAPSRRVSTASQKPKPAIPAKEEGVSRLRRMLLSPVVSGVASNKKDRGLEA